MYDGPRIDAHIHQWDPRVTPRTVTPAVKALGWNPRLLRTLAEKAVPTAMLEFVGDPETALNPYLPGMWRADTRPRRVRGFVHVQADWQAKGPMGVVDETRWLEQVCGSDLLAVVGRVDLASPSLDAILDGHHAASHRFRGIRDYLAHSNGNDALADWASRPDRTAEAAWRRGYDRLGERGLTFDAWAYGHQLPSVATLLGAHPETAVVLDHLGSPVGFGGPFAGVGTTASERDEIIRRWRDDIAAVAAHPQAHVKLSGLAMPISGFGWHRRDVPVTGEEVADGFRPLVHHALEVFGPSRCMVASNFPMDRVSLDFTTLMDAMDLLTEHLDEADRRAVFHDTAASFYGITEDQ